MKFAFLGYHLEQNWARMSSADQDAMIEDCFSYDRKLLKDGHMTGDGAALRPSSTAKTLRWQKGGVVVTDGPFTETKEVIGGYAVLEAKSMAEAVELTRRFLKVHGEEWDIECEVRQLDGPEFGCQTP